MYDGFVMNITVKYMTTIAQRSEEVKWKYITARNILYYTIPHGRWYTIT